jgi:DNA polymerase III delta subunit
MYPNKPLYKNFIQNLSSFAKNKNIPKFTWILGENDYLQAYAHRGIRAYLKAHDINYQTIDLSSDYKQTCPPWEQTSLFAQKSCYYMIYNDNSTYSKLIKRIYLSTNNENSFVFSFKKTQIKKSLSIYTSHTNSHQILCPVLKQHDTLNVITYLCKKLKLHLSNKCINMLIDYLGHDLYKIENEIKRLSLIFYNNSNPSVEEIENELGLIREDHIFEIQNFILTGKQSALHYTINNLLSRGCSALSMVGVFAHFCRNAIKIKHFLSQHTPTYQIAKSVRVPQSVIKLYEIYFKQKSIQQILSALEKCQQADILLKTQKTVPEDLIVADIIHNL